VNEKQNQGKKIMEGYITLTEREMEYLFRIIDSSTSIFLRHQFFLWAQGELQSLLPHGLLICMFDEGSTQPISIEKFSRTNISELTCDPGGRALPPLHYEIY
jgi:hypothetical protein